MRNNYKLHQIERMISPLKHTVTSKVNMALQEMLNNIPQFF